MDDVMRQSCQSRKCCRPVEITGQWRHTVIAQRGATIRIADQRINAVARTQQHRDAQSDVAATDDQQAFHIVSYS